MRGLDAAKQGQRTDSPAPWVLIEAQVFEKFGWRPDELDAMDAGRVLCALEALGIRDRASHDWQKKEAAARRK